MTTEIINCECSFPKFSVVDGINTCKWCKLPDHYKNGVVSDWSDDDEEETDSVMSHDDLDDHGVMCHYSRATGGWQPIEPFCVACGYGYNNCECPCPCSDCGKIHPGAECEDMEIRVCENCAEDFIRGDGYTDDHDQDMIFCSENCYRSYRTLCIECGEPDLEGENRCHSGERECQTCYDIECEYIKNGFVYPKRL